MKIGMLGIIGNCVKSINSHNGGWTLVCKNILERTFENEVEIINDESDFNTYDVIVINEGVNYKEGVYNFFGGVQETTKTKLFKILDFKGELFSINERIDLNHMCKKRKELQGFKDSKFQIPKIFNTDVQFSNILVGDSHSISVYRLGFSINRNDGKTLYGFLKDPQKYFKKPIHSYNKIYTYFGNIDIRFHLCRQSNPKIATEKLVDQYIDWCWNSKAKPVCLLPIEVEDRKIPGTGLYNGKPFYGSRELRSELVSIFNERLQSHFLDCLVWPEEWYDNDYDFTKNMEARQSVHLRPSSYKFYDELSKQETLKLF